MGGQKKFPADLTGQKFGRLTVIGFDHVSDTGVRYWKCRCECGNERVVGRSNLVSGRSRSCGCIPTNRPDEFTAARHKADGPGLSHLYHRWARLRRESRRSNNPVPVCEEWSTFGGFCTWAMANGYQEDGTRVLTRIDPTQPYSPENCYWTSRTDHFDTLNINSSAPSPLITYRGVTMNMSGWARLLGITYETLRFRLKRNNHDLAAACQKPFGIGPGCMGGTKMVDLDKILEDNYNDLPPRPSASEEGN